MKTFKMHAAGEIEIRRQHRAMKDGQANFVEQTKLNASEVAVAEERLGMRGDAFEVEAFDQVVRSVSAANRDDGGSVGIDKRAAKIGEPLLWSSGEIERLAHKSIGSDHR